MYTVLSSLLLPSKLESDRAEIRFARSNPKRNSPTRSFLFVDEPPPVAQGAQGVVVSGCPARKKRINTMKQVFRKRHRFDPGHVHQNYSSPFCNLRCNFLRISARNFGSIGSNRRRREKVSWTYMRKHRDLCIRLGESPTQAVDSIEGTIARTFDGLDRLTQEQTTQGVVGYSYDAASRRTQMTVLASRAR
jgi:YD repeat-containing protein